MSFRTLRGRACIQRGFSARFTFHHRACAAARDLTALLGLHDVFAAVRFWSVGLLME
jgi:hypothetical protein